MAAEAWEPGWSAFAEAAAEAARRGPGAEFDLTVKTVRSGPAAAVSHLLQGAAASAADAAGRGGQGPPVAVEAVLQAVSLGVAVAEPGFLLGVACFLNEARRGVLPGAAAEWRAVLLRRVLADSGSSSPPHGCLEGLDAAAPEMAHELLVWTVAQGGTDPAGAPGTLGALVRNWLVRKPVLLLPLLLSAGGGAAAAGVGPGGGGGGDRWSSGLALVAQAVHAAIRGAVAPTSSGVAARAAARAAVTLHEAALRALRAAGRPEGGGDPGPLELLAGGAAAGLPDDVARGVGPLRWPSRAHADFVAGLAASLPPGGHRLPGVQLTVWDMVEMSVVMAVASAAVSAAGATAMRAALEGVKHHSPFTAFVLQSLDDRVASDDSADADNDDSYG